MNTKALEQFAFQQFSGADEFDPFNFDPELANSFEGSAPVGGGRKAFASEQASFNLTFTNGAAVALTAEIFAVIDSFTKRRKAEYATGNYAYQPWPQLQAVGEAFSQIGFVGFDANGALRINGGAGEGVLTVQCSEISYRGLFESSAITPMKIGRIRLTVQTDGQLDNEIVHFKKSFLGGTTENRVSPRQFFKPDQFQTKIVDIPTSLAIDGDRGIKYIVNAGETVKMNIIVNRYVKDTLA